MDTEIRTIVLAPRYTTYTSARTFLTAPIAVRDFAYVTVTAWRGAGVGTSPTFSVVVQTSDDLEIWTDVGSAFDPDTETNVRYDLAAEWLRVKIILGGTDPAFSCWAIGNFATRTPRGHGG